MMLSFTLSIEDVTPRPSTFWEQFMRLFGISCDSLFVLPVSFLLSFSISSSAFGASAPTLETVANSFVARVTAADFDAAKVCKDFWISSQLSTCLLNIPWADVRAAVPSVKTLVPTAKPDASFVNLGLGASDHLLLTASVESGQWKLSLDLRKVWDRESAKWLKDSNPFEAHFAAPLDPKVRATLELQIKGFEADIAKTLGVSSVGIPFYFVNDPAVAASLGIDFPKQLTGGARDGFVLLVGDPTAGLTSTIYHELVHVYTAFHGSFYRGNGFYPNAAFSEGIATIFTLKQIWKDQIPTTQTATVLCQDVKVAELIQSQDMFQLLDDNFFRALDRQGAHPAYLAAAAIVQPLMNYFELSEFRTLWNDVATAKTLDARKALILSKISEAELREFAKDFYADLRAQMKTNAQFDCR
jgi:hypothetical protein